MPLWSAVVRNDLSKNYTSGYLHFHPGGVFSRRTLWCWVSLSRPRCFWASPEFIWHNGFTILPEKDCLPTTQMICLGILADTVRMVFEVPQDRLPELHEQLLQWLTFADFTKCQLQALLGKLSFVSACVRLGRIFMSCLLNRLCTLPPHQSCFPIQRNAYQH